jgi:hypothetical protein
LRRLTNRRPQSAKRRTTRECLPDLRHTRKATAAGKRLTHPAPLQHGARRQCTTRDSAASAPAQVVVVVVVVVVEAAAEAAAVVADTVEADD